MVPQNSGNIDRDSQEAGTQEQSRPLLQSLAITGASSEADLFMAIAGISSNHQHLWEFRVEMIGNMNIVMGISFSRNLLLGVKSGRDSLGKRWITAFPKCICV